MTTESFTQEQLEAVEAVLREMGLPSFTSWQQGDWCMIDDEVAWSRPENDTRPNPVWPPTWITTPEQEVMYSAAVTHAGRLPYETPSRVVTDDDLAQARRDHA